MKKTAIVIVWGLLMALTAIAQNDKITVQAETRMDYQREMIEDNTVRENCGFKGKYLNVIVKGQLTDNLSFAYRQRLNRGHADESFFDATDWLHLDWKAAENVELSAGKQVIGIGGYEYDRAPIDLYTCSEYWNNIPCYALGVSAALDVNNGKDRLLAQVCESPFARTDSLKGLKALPNHTDMYSYNLMWYGSHGFLNTIYSVNMVEYQPGKFISYIAMGHRLDFGKIALELDFMNRAAEKQTYLLKDCSVMGELQYRPCDKLNIFAKATYDVNKTKRLADFCVMPGTELTLIGGGLEYFPLKDKSLRLHAFASHILGKNGNPAGTNVDKQTRMDVGLRWKIRIL